MKTRRIGPDRYECVETGQRILLDDVGRCYRIYYENTSTDVSHGIGDWATFVRCARRWLRNGEIPIMDVHG